MAKSQPGRDGFPARIMQATQALCTASHDSTTLPRDPPIPTFHCSVQLVDTAGLGEDWNQDHHLVGRRLAGGARRGGRERASDDAVQSVLNLHVSRREGFRRGAARGHVHAAQGSRGKDCNTLGFGRSTPRHLLLHSVAWPLRCCPPWATLPFGVHTCMH